MRVMFYWDLQPPPLPEYVDISPSGKLNSDTLHHMVTEADRKASPSYWANKCPVGVWDLTPRPRVLQISPDRFRTMFEWADRLTASMLSQDYLEKDLRLIRMCQDNYNGLVMGWWWCDIVSDIMLAVETPFFDKLVKRGDSGSRIKAWEETWQTLFHEFTNVAEDKSYVRFAPNAKADEPDEDDY